MHCVACRYPLWNLPSRACPECGMAFVLSTMTFTPSSVRFCCPHCDQQYFGTDANGHLVPKAFDCVRCGRAVTMDEMIVRPIEALEGHEPAVGDMPWMYRAERGTLKAWFQTIGRAMVAPSSLMRAIPADVSGRRAWAFMFVTVTIFYVVGTLPAALLSLVVFGGMARMGGPGGVGPLGPMMWFQVANVVLTLITFLGGAALWMVLSHGLLKLFGGATDSPRRSWQALGFSSAAGALMAIPCGCGHYPGIIWWLVAACIMLGVAHRGSGAAAAWACIVAAVISGALQFAVHIAFAFLVMGNAAAMMGAGMPVGGGMPGYTGPSTVAGATMSMGLRQHAIQHGRWPRHGLELLGKPLQPADFSMNGRGNRSAAAVGSVTLAMLEATPGDWANIARDAARALPDDVVAHRVGDIVFTFHGAPIDPADGSLWLAVHVRQAPPGAIDTVEGRAIIEAGGGRAIIECADGQVQTVAALSLPSLVDAQNQTRANAGLPPLPRDLGAVQVDRPARAGEP